MSHPAPLTAPTCMRSICFVALIASLAACEHTSRVLASVDAHAGDGSGSNTGHDGPVGSGAVGDPCTMDDQCNVVIGGTNEGECVQQAPFTNGYCSGRVAECSAPGDNPCPTGAVCIAPGITQTGGEDYCIKQCGSNSDCRVGDGYSCCLAPDGRGPGCYPTSLCGSGG